MNFRSTLQGTRAGASRHHQASPTSPFIPLVTSCSRNPHFLARVASSRALAALVPPTHVPGLIRTLLGRLPKSADDKMAATNGSNHIHGGRTVLKTRGAVVSCVAFEVEQAVMSVSSSCVVPVVIAILSGRRLLAQLSSADKVSRNTYQLRFQDVVDMVFTLFHNQARSWNGRADRDF